MTGKPQDVTEAELAILEALWKSGPSSVRRIATGLYGSPSTSNTATVQKLLGRLESKGCVDRDPSVWPRLFRPAIERAELVNRRLQITADELCEGSLGPLLTHLVRKATLTPAQRANLRELLEELDVENSGS